MTYACDDGKTGKAELLHVVDIVRGLQLAMNVSLRTKILIDGRMFEQWRWIYCSEHPRRI